MPRPNKSRIRTGSLTGLASLLLQLAARHRFSRNNPFARNSDSLENLRNQLRNYIYNNLNYTPLQAREMNRRVRDLITDDDRSSSHGFVHDTVKIIDAILMGENSHDTTMYPHDEF